MTLSISSWSRPSRLVIATMIAVLPLATIAEGAPPRATARGSSASREATREAALKRAHANWAAAIHRVRPPATGCATAHYPALVWNSAPCEEAPNVPFPPRRMPGRPFQVGNGANDMVPITNPRTTSAEGTFTSISAGISETGIGANNGTSQNDAYTLQLNTNFFSGSSGCTAGSGPNCQGWEQFIYENNSGNHKTFIQYWLIAFNQACPSGWNTFTYPGPTDTSCFRNSAAKSLSANQPVGNLAGMVLKGEATATSDRVTITSGADAATTPGDNRVGLASGWTNSEFNIFGDANSNPANFGANTTMTVRTLVHNGTTNAPTCSLTSFTGETNNLTLTGASAAGPLPSPGVEFTQSNLPGSTASCIGASGVGDTHLQTFTGLLYDFQATGDFILAQAGKFEAQTRQISGAPTWPDAAVNQAVAARLGKYDVAVCSAERPAVWIAGERRELDDGQVIELGDGSGVKREGSFIILVDPDGNSLRAELLGSHIDATVGLGRWPTRVRGLLASSGRAGTVLTGRNGKTYTAPYPFAAFYGGYGESWRVRPGQSLLEVCGRARENGQPKRPLTVRNLDPEKARAARGVCLEAGVAKNHLNACVLDVVVLEDKNAAQAFVNRPAPKVVGPIT